MSGSRRRHGGQPPLATEGMLGSLRRGSGRCASRFPLPAPCSPGMTFIEVMVVLLIMLLIGGAISRLLVRSWESQDVVVGQNSAQQEAARTVDTIVDGLRSASGVQAGDGTEVTCVFSNADTARYYRVGSELRRDWYDHLSGATTIGEVINPHCQSLALQYYLRAGNVLRAPQSPETSADAQIVHVAVTIVQDRNHATETSTVKLRNKT
jgi:type II secretory pathway pseudopilin PulG